MNNDYEDILRGIALLSKPLIGAAIILLNRNNKTLLLKKNYGDFKWSTPGGHIDPGETDWEAAVRELKEETSIELDNIEYKVIDSWISRRTAHIYVVRIDMTPHVKLSEEHSGYRWTPIYDVLDRPDLLSNYIVNSFEEMYHRHQIS